MYGVIDGIFEGDTLKARLYDEDHDHEFFDVCIVTKTDFSEKDWNEIMIAPEAGFIFLIVNNKCILKRKNMTTETKTAETKYIILPSGKTVCLDKILVVSEIMKIEGLCTESYIFHIHYSGQTSPVVMSYGDNKYTASMDCATLSRKLTGEKE